MSDPENVRGGLVYATNHADDPATRHYARQALDAHLNGNTHFQPVDAMETRHPRDGEYVVSYHIANEKMNLLKNLFVEMGEPDYVKFHISPPLVAFEPTTGDDPNGYPVTPAGGGHVVSAGWLETELGFEPERGRYRAYYDDDIAAWIIDMGRGGADD